MIYGYGSLVWAARYAALGIRFRDRATLWLFGFLARSNAHPVRWLRNWLGMRRPLMRLHPKRMAGRAVWVCPFDPGQRIIFEEFFFEETYLLDKVPFTPDQIIDCGAHIGLFSLLAAQRFPSARLIAFEPNPNNYALLERQMADNNVTADLRQAAVSNRAGVANFSSCVGCNGHLTGPNIDGQHYLVDVFNLPAQIREHPPKRLLLKLDIEGEEQNLFPALIEVLPLTCALYFETHFGLEQWTSARSMLESAGFTTEQLNFRNGFADGFALRLQSGPANFQTIH